MHYNNTTNRIIHFNLHTRTHIHSNTYIYTHTHFLSYSPPNQPDACSISTAINFLYSAIFSFDVFNFMTGKSGNTFITARDIYREILKILIVKKKNTILLNIKFLMFIILHKQYEKQRAINRFKSL